MKKVLYCVAWELHAYNDITPKIDYLHALDQANARYLFFLSQPPKIRRYIEIVGIAPVVGHFENQETGKLTYDGVEHART